MRKKIIILGCALVCGILLLTGGFIFGTGWGHYLFCLMNETGWEKAQTRQQLEAKLWWASSQTILPTQSRWGYQYVLKDGEDMVQYLILKDQDCPLDVVYDRNDRVKALFTSYE